MVREPLIQIVKESKAKGAANNIQIKDKGYKWSNLEPEKVGIVKITDENNEAECLLKLIDYVQTISDPTTPVRINIISVGCVSMNEKAKKLIKDKINIDCFD
eukprot:GHVP01060397.1.p3 GENE.GHVP01060397.1~~GHVP01060397.1.p3  ORF type:complete len:102 (-),score=19.09 GHVP01060397.1:4-309(-)